MTRFLGFILLSEKREILKLLASTYEAMYLNVAAFNDAIFVCGPDFLVCTSLTLKKMFKRFPFPHYFSFFSNFYLLLFFA